MANGFPGRRCGRNGRQRELKGSGGERYRGARTGRRGLKGVENDIGRTRWGMGSCGERYRGHCKTVEPCGGARWGRRGLKGSGGERYQGVPGGWQGLRAAVESDIFGAALQDRKVENSEQRRVISGARRGRRGLEGLLENDPAHALRDGQLWRAISRTHCKIAVESDIGECRGTAGLRAAVESDILGAALQDSGVENSGGERYRRDALGDGRG